MKKRLSLFLSVVMIISLFSAFSFNVSAKTVSFEDVTSETNYQAAILSLAKMGLVNGYDEEGKVLFKPDNEINRAEFTAMLIRAMGLDGIDTGASVFTDVADDYWAKNNIKVAYDRGIVNGMGNGTFEPLSSVTFEQAVKMIVCALGYEQEAQRLGGWPMGYVLVAGNIGVRDDVKDVVNTEPAPRGLICQLIHNMLDVEVVEGSQFEGEKQTFMEKYLKMNKSKGLIVGVGKQVTAQCPTTLGVNQMAAIVDNHVMYFDYSEYTDKESDIAKFLGRAVMLYYKADGLGTESLLIDIGDEVTKNTVIEISSDDLIGYSGGSIEYYDSKDKKQSYEIDLASTSFIYNNALVTNNIESKLSKWFDIDGDEVSYNHPDHKIYGTVRITDSGDTGVASLVEIMDYDILVTSKAPTASDYKITNKYKLSTDDGDKSIILDPKGDIDYDISIDGTASDILSIKKDDIVLCAVSEDGEKADIQVSRKTVSGKITESYEDTITIDSKKYTIHDRFAAYIAEKGLSFQVGATVKLNLDMYGNVVFGTVSNTITESPYAYIISAGPDDNDKYFVRMFVPKTNKVAKYTLKDKVTVDGVLLSAEDAVDALKDKSTSVVDGNVVDGKRLNYMDADNANVSNVEESNAAQIARVTISGSMVSSFQTMERNIGDTVVDATALSRYNDCERIRYWGSNNFDNKFYINGNTTVVLIPSDRMENAAYAKKSNGMFTSSSFYHIEAYNVNESKIAGLVLVYDQDASTVSVTVDTKLSLVQGSGDVEVNQNEIPTLKLPYYKTSTSLSKTFIGEAAFESLVPGDLFRAGADKDGNLAYLETHILFNDVKANIDASKAIIAADTGEEIYKWNGDTRFGTPIDRREDYGTFRYDIGMFNIVEVNTDEGIIRVTKDGFVKDGEKYVLPTTNEKRFKIGASVPIFRYDARKNEMTPYAPDTTTALSRDDLKDYTYSGLDCNKVAIYTYYDSVQMIVIYD